jgi:outer membrane protein
MTTRFAALGLLAVTVSAATPALAADGMDARFGWFSGDWRLTVGASGAYLPEFEGDDSYQFRVSPLISLGKVGPEARFISRNDNISIGVIDEGAFRVGISGKIVFPRDEDDSPDLAGLGDVGWGGEIGGFVDVYPLDWLRLRGEVRQGFGAHSGVVADFAADAFYDVLPDLRLSGGPRLSVASKDFFDTYYGVTPAQSVASGLTAYDPGGGLRSAGVGGAITWKTTDRVTTSLFGEYSRLLGPAADSSLVRERGSEDQFLVGVSGTYRFDFTIP